MLKAKRVALAPEPALPVLSRLCRQALDGVALGTAVALIAALFQGVPAIAEPVQPLTPQQDRSVPGGVVKAVPFGPDAAAKAARKGAPEAKAWPKAASAIITVPSPGSAAANGRGNRAAGLPVLVNRPERPDRVRSLAAEVPGRVRVKVLNRSRTGKTFPDGVVFEVGRADGVDAPGKVRMSVDYTAFRDAYGADWSHRLRLSAVPECALSTPDRPGCRPTPVRSRNDGKAVTADVALPKGEASALYALAAGPSGPTGSFAATSLAPSSTWSAGGSSGDFSWSYPLRVPPSLGGPAPELALAYSAQNVDGRHAASNNQPSWIGEGFELWSGYVERSYRSCADEVGTGGNNSTKTGDQCWSVDNATMSLGGKTVELIRDGATGTWRPKTEDGSRVERLTGASNGDNNGEYWKVTTSNGTQYWFGLNRLPGWVDGRPVTNSTWNVPVYGNHSGEPCHQASFDASWCQQAWRWNLDYVVDPHGNSMSYFYTKETNKYGRNLDPAKATPYERGGYLERIDYGTRTEAEFGNAPMRVDFDVADRCAPSTVCDAAHPDSWPDVPWDQSCTSSSCDESGPTFWTQKRLAKITTQVWGGSAYRNVESWTLNHSYPDPLDSTRAGLWLASLSHTGLVGGSLSVPDITFTGVQRANRVDAVDHSPPMNWFRLASIRNETGGEIKVEYSTPDCIAGSRMPSAPESNTLRCYPVMWTPQGADDPIRDYFHKYVVDAVEEIDHTGGAPRTVTTYEYVGAPAWHYSDADGITLAKYRTWAQWRGYEKVRVRSGEPGVGAQSLGETLYFRGMHGDKLPSGTRTVNVTDSQGNTWPDHDALAGQAREEITFDADNDREVSGVITDPWMSAPTATRSIEGSTVYARYVNTGATSHRIALDGGRGYQTTRTAARFDSYGMVTDSDDFGDVNVTGDEQCTRYSYARNTDKWLLSYPSRVETYALSCDQTPTQAADVIGDGRTSYDGQAFGVAPTKGDVTRVESLSAWAGGTPSYVTVSRSAYDAYGRVTESFDPLGHRSTTSYTPAAGAPVTQATTTNELDHVTVTDIEPAWGLTLGSTDPNDRRTDLAYDPLGRLVSVWLPGRDKDANPTAPNSSYQYLIRTNGTVAVSSSTLGPTGTYETSYTLYDGLLRPRQTQRAASGTQGGRVITETLYDSAGRAWKTRGQYVADGAPGTDLFTPSAGDAVVPEIGVTKFDGVSRPTHQIRYSEGTDPPDELWRTTVTYGGDYTATTPPAGATPTRVTTDARGRTAEVWQYHGNTPTGDYDVTRYAYNRQGLLASVTDPAGNVWRYGYDIRGRQVRTEDPDTGVTTSIYDDAGRLTSTTDARGGTLAYGYDALGRKTALHQGSTAGPKLAEWVYDTIVKGHPTSSTAWVDGNAYTTTVSGYTEAYQPTGESITIPASEGALAATYTYAQTYKVDGSPAATTFPAAGDLPRETVSRTYNDMAEPIKLIGMTPYVTDSQYTRYGEPATHLLEYASQSSQFVSVGFTYDTATRRLATQTMQPSIGYAIQQQYTWNPAGMLTKIEETTGGGVPTDTQCFTYDHLQRLSEAWTPASGDCAAARSSDALGGPAPYWQSFTHDKVGNRLSKVDHAVPGDTTGDTTTTYTHPQAGTPQPHTVQSATTTSGGVSSTVTYDYDQAGNTVSRPAQVLGGEQQTLTWTPQGQLASTTDTTGAQTSYVYGADGERLIRRDPTGTTLYLPGMELRLPQGATSATTTRFYEHGGMTVAQRTSSGLTWLIADRQGTNQITVGANSSLPVAQRRQKPYGESRGADVAWPNERGFVGGTNDPTGLVHLGAREYDPELGRFISADPLMDLTNPQQMHGYAYANNNPVTFSDPDGLMVDLGYGDGTDSMGKAGGPADSKPASTKAKNKKKKCGGFWGSMKCKAKNVVKKTVNWVDEHKAEIAGAAAGIVAGAACGVAVGWTGVGAVACGALAGAVGSAVTYLVKTKVQGKEDFSWTGLAKETAIGAVVGAVTGGLTSIAGAALKAGAQAISGGAREALRAAGSAAKAEGRAIAQGAKNLITGGGSRSAGGAAGAATRGKPSCNSFAPAASVLMANGTAKPIAQITAGEKVLATDPETGKTQPRDVVATITGSGVKHLVDITVDTDPKKPGTQPATVTATDGHPFWSPQLKLWIPATTLQVGQLLQTSTGVWIQITALTHHTEIGEVYNLTIATDHTYHVAVGSVAVLVHNCDGTEDFAHGTPRQNGESIVSNGLDESAFHSNEFHSKSSGSFYTVPVTPGEEAAAVDAAKYWGGRHGGETCVIVCSLPKSIVSDLEKRGLLTRTEVPRQAIFHPGAFPVINRYAEWLGPYPE